jgi:uncharacterized membrane protein (DUF106 family)
MKKTLEIIIVLVMFYGIWSLFERVANLIWKEPSITIIVFSALIVSIVMVYLYSLVVGNDAAVRLQYRVNELADLLAKKEKELDEAFALKKSLMQEADLYLKNDSK